MKMCSIFDFAFILYTTKGIQSGEKSEIAHNNVWNFFYLSQQNINNGARVQRFQIGERLTRPNEHDRLPGDVCHRDCGADFKQTLV